MQEVLFKLGYKWSGNDSTCVQLTDKSWLFADNGEITWLDYNYNNVKEVDLEFANFVIESAKVKNRYELKKDGYFNS